MIEHKILFVCLGNICRSPMAEGMFRYLIETDPLANGLAFTIDSAGTGEWHIGKPPDPRAQKAIFERGIDISGLRARQVEREDFDDFDLLLAMDRTNLARLKALAPRDQKHKARLFMAYAPELRVEEVPDPYFGGADGFAYVLDLVEVASLGLLRTLKQGA